MEKTNRAFWDNPVAMTTLDYLQESLCDCRYVENDLKKIEDKLLALWCEALKQSNDLQYNEGYDAGQADTKAGEARHDGM